MKVSIRLNGLRKVVFAALIGIFAIGAWQTVSAKENPNENFLTSVFGSISNLFAGNNNQQTKLQNNPVFDDQVIGTCDTSGPIEVESTGGITTPTAYATLKGAFDAINAGTHTGAINVEVCGNTTETATASLEGSGVTTASYTSITMRPVGAGRIIEGSIIGAIVKLNGADNVTIDGRQGGTGTARDLTIRNNNASGSTAAIWLASVAAGNGAANNTIRNLEIAAGATQNTLTVSTFGIIMSGTTISTTANGVDNDNNSFVANRIVKARYGIVTRGTTTDLNISPVVTDNIVGPTAFGTDQIGKVGIFMQADTGALVSRNTVQFVGGDFANTTAGADRVGIGIGSESWSSSAPGTLTSNNYTVTRNIIHDIVEQRTFSSVGIDLATTGGGSPTNNLVANNFIYNIVANGTSGDQPVGIGIAGGFSDNVVFNSISMTGDMDGTGASAAATYGNAIRIANASGTTHQNLNLKDNSIYMDVNSNTTTLPYFAITINSATYAFGTGGLNYNNYYINQANTQMNTGGITTSGTAPTAGLTYKTLANWQTALTPAQDQNSIQADPQYVSNTADLHIAAGSPNVNAGIAAGGVNNDIDGQLRVAAPDIGADEPAGVAPPMNDIAATAIINPPSGSTRGAGVPFTPQASFTNNGTNAQTNVTVRFRILDASMVEVYNQTATIASIAPGATVTVSFPAATIAGAGSYTTIASVELAGDQNTANDSVQGTLTVIPPFTGSYNVGTAETITSLTNTGGIFDLINSAGATGNITINITSDLTAETGTVALNEVNGGFTVTIKPSGAARTISGSSTTAIIRLNDADGVTIDGSLTGGTAGDTVGGNASLRNLTIQNNSVSTSSAVVIIGSNTNGAQNNTIKNTNVSGNDPLTTLIGISIGGAAPGSAGVDNDGNRVENCSLQKSVLGVYNAGASTTNPNTANVITKNEMAATTTNRLQRGAILIFNHDGAQVTLNNIGGINGAVGIDHYGIGAGTQDATATAVANGGITNTTISRNRINGVVSTSTTGFSAYGIGIAGGTTGANTIANNMITGVSAPSTSPDLVAGIFVASVTGSNTKVYFNSVSMTGDRMVTGGSATQMPGFGIAYTADVAIELKDNIFYTTQVSTGGGANAKSYAIGTAATTFVNLDSNYNDFWSTGANDGGFRSGSLSTAAGTDYATLAAWQTAVSDDANSQEVDPLFVSDLNDLHLQATTPLENDGTPVAGITVDFDGNPRSATTPDIGADELFVAVPGTLAFSSATYSVGEGGGTVTLTVNRTGGTDGTVTVDYALGGGTATGGAACGGGVDYVNTGGTLSFANGEASKTFNVTICEDSTFETNETFNATLSNATGGATIGTPNPATVTITENKGQPTVQFSSSTYSTTEAFSGGQNGINPSVTLTVTLSGASQSVVTVDYATASGTATGGASCGAGIDYINASGTLTFNAGETSKSFSVTTCADTVFEGNETFTATLSNVTGGAALGTPATATVTIIENDAPVPGTLQFSSATYTVGEAGPTATITVTRTGGSDGAVTAAYATSNGTATGGASCGGAVDFVNTSGTVTFGSGVTTPQTFSVPICDDTTVEGDETVNLTLSNATGGATIGSPATAVLTITDNDVTPTGPVTVTATAGTASATYNTLTEAVAAVNSGTHQGAIVININQTITEPGTVVINGSGAGAASYTSILIQPGADNVTDSGASAQGRGLIELNGADNVTINGDNPNTAGISRNLTLQNTAANTVTFTSVIRVAVAVTAVTTADNNAFRNLNILGSATGRNIAAAITTTGTENTTFGIFAGPGASTTDGTAAPAAVASVLTGVAAGATATNLVVSNNNIRTAARAVSINGSATSVFPGLQIAGNQIGNPTAGDPDQVYAIGITAQGSLDAAIRDNLVWVEGYIPSSASTHGINVGVNSTAITGATIERNMVNRVRNNNGQTWSAFGINLGGGNNHVVQNNFVSGVINSQSAGTGGFGTTFGAYGIRVAAGTGHKVYHNSVNLYGAIPGAISTNLTAAFLVVATSQTGLDVRNNIFSNQITGGNTASPGTRNVAVFLPSGGTATMNLTLNNNAYYVGTDANNRLAQVGTTFGTGEYTAGNFDPTSTTPATNFRAYTSTLSAAGTNDNASFASTAPPPFTSNSNLHIPAGSATRLESGGAAVGVTQDIDLEARNATTPDIGADEFAGNPPAANDIAAVAFVVPANGSTIPTGTFNPVARYNNNGTATQTNVPVRFRILNSSNVEVYNQTATIASIAPLQNVDVTFPPATISMAGTYTMIASVENPGDSNPANDSITGTFNTVVPFSGTVNVGTGETYTSLTNPGGIFQAINTAGASGNFVINITSDLTGETGTVSLNEIAGGFTVTIKPSGAARTISGTSTATNGLIPFNATDNVTIDGSLSGGSDRSLTIQNLVTTNIGGGIYFASGTNGAQNNTIKNVNVWGTSSTGSLLGITFASSTFGGLGADLDNNRIENNDIRGAFYGIAVLGASAANKNVGTVITRNVMPATGTAGIGRIGIYVVNDDGGQFTQNNIASVSSNTAVDNIGIALGSQNMSLTAPVPADVTNALVARNYIGVVNNPATNSSVGIVMASGTTGTNTVVNNMVTGVIGNADITATTALDFVAGIYVIPQAGSTQNIYHNSVSMTGDRGTTANQSPSYAVAISADQPVNLVNNILVNSQTRTGATGGGGESYAIGFDGAAANVNLVSNYNDLFVSGPLGQTGITGDLTTAAQTTVAGTGTNRTTLADWRTATGEDANSIAADPLFVSTTNLHLLAGSPAINAGTSVGVTSDYDGETRDTMPDIGADEFIAAPNPGSVQFSSPTYSIGEAGGTATITVTRTGGSAGSVTVNYATGGGSATGGAACTAGVDYISTSGTLTFADGVTSQTFNVTICSDATFESNETFNTTLSNPTGGVTIGTPNPATVTIVDDDPAPTVTSFSINDVKVIEGNSGTVTATFTVTASPAPPATATVNYSTANGTATAGSDYVATTGTLTFNAGDTTKTISVTINGDTVKEQNEFFFVNLSGASSNASITDGQGVGIIVDEDRAYLADYDRDLKTDFSVYRPSNSVFYVSKSTKGFPIFQSMGQTGDISVPGDYDNDGKTDFAVWRPSTGSWLVQKSSDNTMLNIVWGVSGDKPVQGDYNGDGQTDYAVYRPSQGTWYILPSSTFTPYGIQFGISTDRPVQADYDGDFKTDIAVYRDGVWYILRSSNGAVSIINWGLASDKPVIGDFDCDGRNDLAVYRNGFWYILNSLTNTATVLSWGLSDDIPVPADFDGDSKSDIAVFRPSTGDWYILKNPTPLVFHWGQNGDVPVPASYIPQ